MKVPKVEDPSTRVVEVHRNFFLISNGRGFFTRPIPTNVDSETIINLTGHNESAGEYVKRWAARKCRTAQEVEYAKRFLAYPNPVEEGGIPAVKINARPGRA